MEETPLDVLSRAASLVQTSEANGESLYKRTSPPHHDDRESPSKELPSKLLKLERLKERQDLPQTLNFDKDHADKYSSKKTCTAGTQTQFTSFNGDNYNYSNPVSSDAYSSWHGLPPLPPPPPFPSQTSSPSRDIDVASPGVQNVPLNLSRTSNGSLRSPNPVRPSVITTSPGSLQNGNSTRYLPRSPSSSPSELSPTASHPEIPAVINDPAIEEHFRRSLGKNYAEKIPAKPPSIAIVKENVSITGSVDDHFAKSLGDTTWTAIKAKSDPIKDMFSGSVDDHFAKALGDTWLRIKAEKETGCLSSNCSSPSGSPQHSSALTT
ncbi:transcription cofactor vestigial-like protein 4 isoform X2 [Gigantopelta aegis]|uniref:transcription cofactor vestigial-like protein 4 isoform X2 n=1 Tax=Gigantopelta aegis TaxID=1735272 RepID=UPI001B8880D2|nr:transcription cofactor vestigial-like protein 4 isoform X2 [Gigantopelta aegis]